MLPWWFTFVNWIGISQRSHLRTKRIFQTVPEKYLCVSNAVKTNLVENYDIPAERCHIVPVGLNVDMIMNAAAERSPESVRDELGLKEDDFVITMCGTLDKRKGWELVVGACRHLTKYVRHWHEALFRLDWRWG